MALYEGMFLLDNDTVRAGWAGAKARVSDLVKKHGGSVVTARRWDERPLAYPIRGKHRATYLLTFFEMDGAAIAPFQRDLEISDAVLRYLQLRVEAVPEGERELAEAEEAADFAVPEPPKDEAPPIAPELFAVREERPPRRRDEEGEGKKDRDEKAEGDERAESKDEDKAEAGETAEKAEGEPAEKPASGAPATAVAAPAAKTDDEKKED